MADSCSDLLVKAARQLAREVAALRFPSPVTHVYNPLAYAWAAHEQYLRRFAGSQKHVVFVGMNPGPFGMVQTGIPFGEIAAVRDWMKIDAPIGRPRKEHPKRPVLGFNCARCEVSGQRLWGLFAQRFETADRFFRDHFVVNYCPLAFLEAGGRNFTPDKLPRAIHAELFAVCDAHLRRVIEVLRPEWLIGVGAFAFQRVDAVASGLAVRRSQILHPSPASPAANRDWARQVSAQLRQCGAWKAG